MSIFIIRDIDNILLSFCDVIDDFIIVNRLNKYYRQLTTNNILFKSWIKLYTFDKKTIMTNIIKNELFMNACGTNSLIDIHVYGECAFRYRTVVAGFGRTIEFID